MPPYDIQFQKGLSLREFMARYGSEDQCIEAVCKVRWPRGFECPECGSNRHCHLARGLFQCQDCRKQTSPTAGTLFQGTELLLTVWFQAMHPLTQGKHSVSALELKRRLGVHYETAWAIKHKLMQAMLERESRTVLSGRIEVDDAYMGGGTSRREAGPRRPRQDAFCRGCSNRSGAPSQSASNENEGPSGRGKEGAEGRDLPFASSCMVFR